MKHNETTFGSLYTVSHFLRFFDSYTFQVLIHNFSPQTKNAKNHSMIKQQNNNKGMCQILVSLQVDEDSRPSFSDLAEHFDQVIRLEANPNIFGISKDLGILYSWNPNFLWQKYFENRKMRTKHEKM